MFLLRANPVIQILQICTIAWSCKFAEYNGQSLQTKRNLGFARGIWYFGFPRGKLLMTITKLLYYLTISAGVLASSNDKHCARSIYFYYLTKPMLACHHKERFYLTIILQEVMLYHQTKQIFYFLWTVTPVDKSKSIFTKPILAWPSP